MLLLNTTYFYETEEREDHEEGVDENGCYLAPHDVKLLRLMKQFNITLKEYHPYKGSPFKYICPSSDPDAPPPRQYTFTTFGRDWPNKHGLDQIRSENEEVFALLKDKLEEIKRSDIKHAEWLPYTEETFPHCFRNRTLPPRALDTLTPEEQKDRSKIVCLPTFYIAGVTKCGTTDLALRLWRHPEVRKPSQKEFFYWSHRLMYFEEYLDQFKWFNNLVGEQFRIVNAATTQKSLPGFKRLQTFEGSPSTYWGGLPGQKVSNPELLRYLQPRSRFVLSLRSPTDRLWSEFIFFNLPMLDSTYFYKNVTAYAALPELFHLVVERELSKWSQCIEQFSSEPEGPSAAPFMCALSMEFQYTRIRWGNFYLFPPRIVLGMYGHFLRLWWSHWPKDRLLLMRLEDESKDPKAHLNRVHDFLGLAHIDPNDNLWGWILNGTEKNNNVVAVFNHFNKSAKEMEGEVPFPKIRSDTRKLLDDFYRPFNELLAEMTDDPGFLWERPPSSSTSPA